MEKVTHRIIAEVIAEVFGLLPSEKKELVRVATSLDEFDRRSRSRSRKRHHSYWTINRILKYMETARQYCLRGNFGSAIWYLGAALHLAQDIAVPSPSKSKRHHSIEAAISSLVNRRNVERDVRNFLKGISPPHEEYVKLHALLPIYFSGESEINKVYLRVIELSTRIMYAVLGNNSPPDEVKERLKELRSDVLKYKVKLEELRSRHNLYLKKALKAFLAGLIPISLLAMIITLTGMFPFLFWVPIVLIAILAKRSYRILRQDIEYYNAEREYWMAVRQFNKYTQTLEVSWYRGMDSI